jgi:rhomboid protease GluP
VFGRKRTGSVLCTSCGVLVGVNDDKCYNCGRRNPALWGFAPALRALGNDLGFVPIVIGLCAIMYVLTLVASAGITRGGMLGLFGPDGGALFIFGASGAGPMIYERRWWTPLSAGWLHGGLIHIALNMLSLRTLAPLVVDFYGPARDGDHLYPRGRRRLHGELGDRGLSACVPAHRRQSYPSQHLTVGASASLAGLLGALLYYGHRSGSSMVRGQANQWIMSMLVFGLLIPRIDNYAHIGGLAGGYVTSKLLDPLKPERGDHVVIALLCLAASVAAILYSAIPVLIELNRR